MTQTDDIKMVVTYDRQERQPITAVWQNWRFSASYDSLVGKQTLVLRRKFCAENRQLRQAANRYAAGYDDSTNINKKLKIWTQTK